jgi:putative transposase
MLAQAVDAEVDAFMANFSGERNAHGFQRLVRNGYLPEREIQTGVGPVKVKMPRVRDKGSGPGERIGFSSKILPPYLRRTKSIEEMIPWLYLKGISTGDFSEALAALLGKDAPGLSASTVSRLKEVWKKDMAAWQKRDLSRKRYVYFWADGIHFKVRLDQSKQCILVIIGSDEKGNKELVGIWDGYRESEQSWKELLLDLKRRGLKNGPKLAIGDGGLGFWKALPQVYGQTRTQRCWVHKAGNVLNKLPKGAQNKPSNGCMKSGWPKPKRRPGRRLITSLTPFRPNTPRRLVAWKKTVRNSWPSTTSPPNTGSISAPPTPLSPPLPP